MPAQRAAAGGEAAAAAAAMAAPAAAAAAATGVPLFACMRPGGAGAGARVTWATKSAAALVRCFLAAAALYWVVALLRSPPHVLGSARRISASDRFSVAAAAVSSQWVTWVRRWVTPPQWRRVPPKVESQQLIWLQRSHLK